MPTIFRNENIKTLRFEIQTFELFAKIKVWVSKEKEQKAKSSQKPTTQMQMWLPSYRELPSGL